MALSRYLVFGYFVPLGWAWVAVILDSKDPVVVGFFGAETWFLLLPSLLLGVKALLKRLRPLCTCHISGFGPVCAL